jgi:tetratricopeptide (TPR) repeat protein
MVQKTKFHNRQRALSEATQLVYLGKLTKAVELVKKEYSVNSYEYYFFKGWVNQIKKNNVEAVKWFEKSLQKNPLNEYALEGLVYCYIDLREFNLALECAEQLFSIDRKNAKNLFVLATARSLYYRGDKDKLSQVPELFSESYDLAIADKDFTLLKDVLIGWGACLVDLRNFEEAKIVLETVKLQDPSNDIIHKNLASVYAGLNLTDKAIESCNIAKLSDDPSIANDALYQLGMLLLSKGDYNPGWRLHEFRHSLQHFDYRPTKTLNFWNGEVLTEDKDSVLLYQEQGIGDTIQFSRYIREVSKRVKNVDLLVHANTYMPWEKVGTEPNSLKSLLKENYPELSNIYIKDWDYLDYSKYTSMCSLMSLPRIFKTTLSNIPSIPYLTTSVKSELETSDIGIFWRGSAAHANDENRSVPTHIVNSFIDNNNNKTFINLQIDRDEDLAPRDNITNAKDYIKDFRDTLAILNKCRVVITVDSMIAHLACSANIPTFILHADSADWRWLIKRRDSPWYPSAINLHQDSNKNWVTVFTQLQEEIDALFQSKILID